MRWVRVRHRLAALASAVVVAASSVIAVPVAVPSSAPPATAAASFSDAWFREDPTITGLTRPMSVRFAADGRVFIAEKAGIVKAFDSVADTTPTTVLDIRGEVNSYWDRGVLGIALDPQFTTSRPYLYIYYVYDAPPGQVAPVWNDTCPDPPSGLKDGCVVTSKVARYTVGAGNAASPASRVELLHDWCQQYPSHTGGGIAFGQYGELYISGGEGGSFNVTDYGQLGGTLPTPQNPVTPVNPCNDPVTLLAPKPDGAPNVDIVSAQGGSLRSQDARTTADAQSLDGAIIRINPDTGAAYASNPYASSGDANRGRIVAFGLRNPFRMAFRPGTSDLYAGDVGGAYWEEINRIQVPIGGTSAPNFGWPCYEGPGQSGWKSLGNTLCDTLYADMSAGDRAKAPLFAYSHQSTLLPTGMCFVPNSNGRMGGSVSGLAFYTGGGASPYPAKYNGALFFTDYSRKCMGVMLAGAGGVPDPSTFSTFQTGTSFPVDLTTGPGGYLFYIDHDGGRIMRITFAEAPVAVAKATPSTGLAPLDVTLDGTASTDPSGGGITAWAWDIDGDGQYDDATGSVVGHTFTEAKVHTVGLRVTNAAGRAGTGSVIVDATNTKPVPKITGPSASLTWAVGDTINFLGYASDVEDGLLPPSALTWEVSMRHCAPTCHDHLIETFTGVDRGGFLAPDHEYPSQLLIRMFATDSNGNTVSKAILLAPKTTTVSVASVPAGIPVFIAEQDQTTPAQATVILKGTVTVSAPLAAVVGGVGYRFDGWSDGGTRTRDVYAGGPVSLTANYLPDAPDACAGAGVDGAAGASPKDTWIRDRLSAGGDVDWFRFQLGAPRTVIATLGDLPVNGRLDLYSGCGTLLATSDVGAGARWEEFTRTLPTGTYRLRVTSPSGGASASQYVVRIRVLAPSAFAIKSSVTDVNGTAVRIAGELLNATGSAREAIVVTADFRDGGGAAVGSLSTAPFMPQLANLGVSPFVLSGTVPAFSTVTWRFTSAAAGASALPTFSVGAVTITPGAGGTATETGSVTNTSAATAKSVVVLRGWYGVRGQLLDAGNDGASPVDLAPGASGAFSVSRSALPTIQGYRTFVRGAF